MDIATHELDYRAQAHWHHFHYRIGELIGLDAAYPFPFEGPDVSRVHREVARAQRGS